MNTYPPVNAAVLDIRGEVCPTSLIRVKKACESLQAGESLRILTDHLPVVEETVPIFAERHGFSMRLLAHTRDPREEWEVLLHREQKDDSREPVIRLQGLTKNFSSEHGAHTALDHLDLDIHSGEFICVLGPSGCGKSTLLNLVAGFEKPDAGTLTGKHGGALPQRIMIFQELALFPWLSALDNVMFGLRYHRISRRAKRELAMDFLARVGLKGFEKHRIHHLSGGMRQRVALARALILDPDVLLMDEPFAALDALTKQGLYNDLIGLTRQADKAVLFITHDIREAVWLADKILVMQPGGKLRATFDLGRTAPRPTGLPESDEWVQRIQPELAESATIPHPSPKREKDAKTR